MFEPHPVFVRDVALASKPRTCTWQDHSKYVYAYVPWDLLREDPQTCAKTKGLWIPLQETSETWLRKEWFQTHKLQAVEFLLIEKEPKDQEDLDSILSAVPNATRLTADISIPDHLIHVGFTRQDVLLTSKALAKQYTHIKNQCKQFMRLEVVYKRETTLYNEYYVVEQCHSVTTVIHGTLRQGATFKDDSIMDVIDVENDIHKLVPYVNVKYMSSYSMRL